MSRLLPPVPPAAARDIFGTRNAGASAAPVARQRPEGSPNRDGHEGRAGAPRRVQSTAPEAAEAPVAGARPLGEERHAISEAQMIDDFAERSPVAHAASDAHGA